MLFEGRIETTIFIPTYGFAHLPVLIYPFGFRYAANAATQPSRLPNQQDYFLLSKNHFTVSLMLTYNERG